MGNGDKRFDNRVEGSRGVVIGETVTVGNMTFNEIPSPAEEARHLFETGKKYLEARSYGQAEKAFRSALEKSADSTETGYYLALAILAGRRPRTLHRKQILEIDEIMRPLFEASTPQYHQILLLAFVRYDYFLMNGQKSPDPTPAELLKMLPALLPDKTALYELLRHLPQIDNPPGTFFKPPD